MTAQEILAALALPPQAMLYQRIPKKHLLENAAITSADKKAITDGIEELVWVATLKPNTIGVATYEDADRSYLEIAVLSLTLRENAKTARLRELVHRAIPYPVVLISSQNEEIAVSLCEIRHAQNDSSKIVLDGELRQVVVLGGAIGEAFCASLAMNGLPVANLRLLYQGWIERLTRLEAAQLLGHWPQVLHPVRQREAVAAIRQLDARIDELHRQAQGEAQVAKKVELNLELQKLRKERSHWLAQLG